MPRPRNRARLYSVQGFFLRSVSWGEALHLEDLSQVHHDGSGKFTFTSYEKERDYSPTCITSSDMKLNAGLCGDPSPESKRRDGFIDPIEAARDKVSAWPSIGDVKREVFVGIFCPWPRQDYCFGEVTDPGASLERPVISDEMRQWWRERLTHGHVV